MEGTQKPPNRNPLHLCAAPLLHPHFITHKSPSLAQTALASPPVTSLCLPHWPPCCFLKKPGPLQMLFPSFHMHVLTRYSQGSLICSTFMMRPTPTTLFKIAAPLTPALLFLYVSFIYCFTKLQVPPEQAFCLSSCI